MAEGDGATFVATGMSGGFAITEDGLRAMAPDGQLGSHVGPAESLSPFADPAPHQQERPPVNPLQASLEFARQHTEPRPKPASPQRLAIKPGDVVRLAKHQLRQLRAEIKRLKGLEREANELERLIKAAQTKPKKAAVAALRTAT